MGYTHYWYRPAEINASIFNTIRLDLEKLILPLSDEGVALAGPFGEGPPEITDSVIAFNGVSDCGHPSNEDLIIPYPSLYAQGLGPASNAIDGDFYGVGVTIRHRCCFGGCSCETFVLARSIDAALRNPDEHGLFCEFVKTAFRPYDIAVTAALLIAKRHLGDLFLVHSNGAESQWLDAKRLCQRILGYGEWFGIVEETIEENCPSPDGGTEKRTVTERSLVGTVMPAGTMS